MVMANRTKASEQLSEFAQSRKINVFDVISLANDVMAE